MACFKAVLTFALAEPAKSHIHDSRVDCVNFRWSQIKCLHFSGSKAFEENIDVWQNFGFETLYVF